MRDNKISILFAEPDHAVLNATTKRLRNQGYRVVAVGNGQEALEVLFRETIDLVLSAVRMPELDGLGLMQAIRRTKVNVPVIFVTAFADVESYMDLMNMGAFQYLNKPFKGEDILRIIENALRNTASGSRFLYQSHHDSLEHTPIDMKAVDRNDV